MSKWLRNVHTGFRLDETVPEAVSHLIPSQDRNTLHTYTIEALMAQSHEIESVDMWYE